MNELVIIRNNEIFTDSLIIADGTKNQHNSIKKLIVNYQNEFEELGKVWILNRTLKTKGGLQESTYYELNEQQATFLMTLLRNNPVVVRFKLELVKQFYQMRIILQGGMISTIDTALESRMAAIEQQISKMPIVLPVTPLNEKRLLSINEFMEYASVGRNTAYRLAKESESEFRIIRHILIDRLKFDEWCNLNGKPMNRRKKKGLI